ncbi:DUF3035 domain-containing protein [Lutimaribacter sp. EGI FJ00015]|uniref:DUF3035 domain-containing protein n=1 Tax=Lutimaribacter degradans TaxID=2945989 RepID=A0ACC6A019_9RHOB|nr:DUF3035 domain-containing protein [Lutimaribacter sp. EGI FJ00013]MCM2563420.1 DUF3035 domain-containing protein [Lutimaribacter sp. EGI FJ00013]MCO0614502.1 DUF3035 domain-containing protein [Lutimaribacter sp. EGI FJ00015]MCO0637175.1 DUF3035 domain-containing protein [Lutimaribacter sp. EGI FJ00014]
MRITQASIGLVLILAVAGCARGDREVDLRQLTSADGTPDEFSVLPSKPLQSPDNFNNLPTPNPGGRNLVDQNPRADAVASLGGRPSALEGDGVPGGDAALVRHAARGGVPGNIRETVAQEDEEFRQRRGRFQKLRIFVKNKYNSVYERQTLDSSRTNQAYRRVGVPTPSSPPTNSRR